MRTILLDVLSFVALIVLIIILAQHNQRNDVKETTRAQTLYPAPRMEPWLPTPRVSTENSPVGREDYRRRAEREAGDVLGMFRYWDALASRRNFGSYTSSL